MAIGTTAAILGGGSLVASVLGARSQSRAASHAADAAQDSSDAQIALARDISDEQIELARETRDGQIERSEPFRQLELQQGNAIGEIYGFNRVGDTQTQHRPPQPQAQARPPQQSFNSFIGSGIGGTRFNPQNQGRLTNGAISETHANQPTIFDFSRGYNPQQNVATAAPVQRQAVPPPSLKLGVSPNGINTGAQDAARQRFEGSMFNDVYRAGHARDVDRIDAGLGASGLAFSGARMQAVEDARADRFGNTFNSYFSGLMRQAPQSATNSQNAAASQFGANAASATGQYGASAGGAIGQNGLAQQNSAYQRGAANASIWNDVAGFGGFAAGGGFSKPTSGGI